MSRGDSAARRLCILPALACAVAATACDDVDRAAPEPSLRSSPPIVIAHRGASGERPEHTLEAYQLAIEQGADFIEPDLVATKDGVLVARHENEISGATDVASHPEFAARRTAKTIDGVTVTGWFSEDFTLEELKTLRARERLPQLRGTAYDGRFQVPTLEEILDLVAAANRSRGRERSPIGLYPETKHPSYFDAIGLALEEPLLRALEAHGLRGPSAPVFIQSFEVGNLKELRQRTELPLIQLIAAEGRPYDFTARGDPRSYADLLRPEGLAEIARYARGIGVDKRCILPRDAGNRLLAPTTLVRDARRQGLLVHVWTFRAENFFLPAPFQRGGGPAQHGDVAGEIGVFLQHGIDGFFTDHVAIGRAALPRSDATGR